MEICPRCKKEVKLIVHTTMAEEDFYYEEICPECNELVREGN